MIRSLLLVAILGVLYYFNISFFSKIMKITKNSTLKTIGIIFFAINFIIATIFLLLNLFYSFTVINDANMLFILSPYAIIILGLYALLQYNILKKYKN